LLELRQKEFEKARANFKPSVEETLHEMRIALKKLRYVVEAAEPVLGEWTKESTRNMQACQTLLGDTRDVAILQAGLQEWADKKGKKVRKGIAPVLTQLKRERARLLKKITQSAASFEDLRPFKESTVAAVEAGTKEAAPTTEESNLEQPGES
jgi:CHAD domain-containing protein